MATTFAWLTVVVDAVTAIVFLRVGAMAAHRLLAATGTALMGTAALMLGAILFGNPGLASYGYAIGWVICFIGLGLIARPSKR